MHAAGAKGRFLNYAVAVVRPNHTGIPTDKKQLVSTFVSSKKHTVGHVLRHTAVKRFGDRLGHVFGTGFAPLEDKVMCVCVCLCVGGWIGGCL